MIETAESKAQFEKRRAKAIAAFKHAVKGELPLDISPDIHRKSAGVLEVNDGCQNENLTQQLTEAIKGRAEAEQRVAQHESKRKHRKRDKYWWREYRKRPKTCPHCGKEL